MTPLAVSISTPGRCPGRPAAPRLGQHRHRRCRSVGQSRTDVAQRHRRRRRMRPFSSPRHRY